MNTAEEKTCLCKNNMTERLVDVKEMASILGVPVSWLYQRTCLGSEAIPFVKVGKYVRFDPEEVLAFLRAKGHDGKGS